MAKNKILIFTLRMALGTFVVVMDNTIMNVSIQSLVQDLHTTVAGVQSAIALNIMGMAAFVLFGGKLADIIGMKRTFMTPLLFAQVTYLRFANIEPQRTFASRSSTTIPITSGFGKPMISNMK